MRLLPATATGLCGCVDLRLTASVATTAAGGWSFAACSIPGLTAAAVAASAPDAAAAAAEAGRVGGGVGGSRGSRRGRRRGTRGTTRGTVMTTTGRRRVPCAPPPPFPWGRQWWSPGLFLSFRVEVRMDLDPEGEQEGEGGVGENERINDADNTREKDAAWSFVSFSSERDEKALASSSPIFR